MEALLQGAGGHSEALRSPLDPRNKKSRFGVFETNQKAIFLNRQITLNLVAPIIDLELFTM